MRGLCPPAFSGPWLKPGAPWQDNCEPKPFWKEKKKHPEGGENISGAVVTFSQKTDQMFHFPNEVREQASRLLQWQNASFA